MVMITTATADFLTSLVKKSPASTQNVGVKNQKNPPSQ